MIVHLAIPEAVELGAGKGLRRIVHDEVAWAVHGSLKK